MMRLVCLIFAVVLCFPCGGLFAADPVSPVPVVVQPDLISQLIALLNPAMIAVLGGLWYFLSGKKLPAPTPAVPQPAITGRPVLDLMVRMAIEKIGDNPLLVNIVTAEAMAIKLMLDKYGVPEVPLPKV